jgi:hypothetical protein
MRAGFVVHLTAAALFAGLAIALTWPLAIHLHEGTLGAGIGDNATFVWNFWWVRHAIADGVSPFWTPYLFAPLGTSLLLHTTTLLPTATATVLLPRAEPITTHNIALIATVFLNGLCAYGAACALKRRASATSAADAAKASKALDARGDLSLVDAYRAIVAGITFAASPFLVARMQGHFNVLSAWGLPLLVMALARFNRVAGSGGATITNAALIAGALAALAYTDYYFFIFGVALTAIYVSRVDINATPLTPARSRALRVLAIVAIGLIAAIAIIEMSGGGDLNIAGVQVSARGTFNLRGALSIAGLIALIVWKRPRVSLGAVPWRAVATGAGLLALALSPLIVAAANTIASGDYATQTYLWRSAPPGIDIGALILGNPFHPLYGSLTRAAYAHLHIDPVESVAWLGLIPMACLLFACFAPQCKPQPEVQRLLLIVAVFFVWALGPYLMTFGANSGLILPQTLLRFVPLLANARIPGRAFVMVALGASLLLAFVLPRKPSLVGLAAVLILLDYWPAPQAFVPFDRPPLYATLRSLPAGPVLDLPLGLRDGFGEGGHLDHHALFYQTLHEHPIGGGFVARLSPRVRRAYEDDPVLSVLLSEKAITAPPAQAQTLACAFRYVILPKASPALTVDVVNRVFELERLDADDARDLYRVTKCRMSR